MVAGKDAVVEGYVDCLRSSWVVHLMLIHDGLDAKDTAANASSNNDIRNIYSCLEVIFSNNVFQSWLNKILLTPAYQVKIVFLDLIKELLIVFLSHSPYQSLFWV